MIFGILALLCLGEFYASLHSGRIHAKGCGRESLDWLVVLRVTPTNAAIKPELRTRFHIFAYRFMRNDKAIGRDKVLSQTLQSACAPFPVLLQSRDT